MNKKRGKFIVLEGIDGSGKSLQLSLLGKRLKKEKRKILIADFPRYYTSVWGKIVGKFLKGELGNFENTSPYLAVFPYMVDEYTWSRDMARVWIEKGGLIISNRYFTSNVHQIAKLEGKKRSLYRKWLWNSGYNHLKILKPDLVLFLDVLPKEAKNWIKNKTFRSYLTGSNQDLAEKSYRHQLAAYREYLYSVKTFKYWKRIGCYSKKDVLSPQEIHEKIWKEVCKVI